MPPAATTTLGCSVAIDDAQCRTGRPRDVQEHAHGGKHREQARVSIGHEWERNSGQWSKPQHGEEVDHGLDHDERGEARGEQLRVGVARLARGLEPGVTEEAEEADDHRDADQAELLADHRGDHVRVRLGQVEGLLEALPQPDAEEPAGAESDLGLVCLEAGARRVGRPG